MTPPDNPPSPDLTHPQVQAALEDARQARKELEVYKKKYATLMVRDAVAHALTGLQDNALDTTQSLVENWFTLSDNGKVEPTHQAPYTPNGPLRIEQLQSYLQRTKPFLFKSGSTLGTAGAAPALERSKMTNAEKADFIRTHGGPAYEQLPW